jgi:uncharacterized protein
MGAIVHCEIRVRYMDRAAAFYTKVFGWIIKPLGDGYFMVHAGRATYGNGQTVGIDAVLAQRTGPEPTLEQAGSGYICNIEVEDIDATLEKIKAAGGKVVREKQTLEGVGAEAFCLDTEGNMISVMRDDTQQKLIPPTNER